MDRDELIEELTGMDRRLSDLQSVVYEMLKPQVDDLQDRVDELEAENQRLRERLDEGGAGGKDEKVAAIVQYAHEARGSAPAVKLTAKEISGAAGVTRRYAYNLMDGEDGLPAEYDWFLTPGEMQQYGSLQVDNDERRLGIDFEGVHSAGCPLNKFITQPQGGEGPR